MHNSMDSTVYSHLIEKLRPRVVRACPDVPAHFALSGVRSDTHAVEALKMFLRQITAPGTAGTAFFPPSLLTTPDTAVPSSLFQELHGAVINALEGTHPPRDVARRQTGLLRVLVGWADPADPGAPLPTDTTDLAMMLFAVEACMHFGWCPNAAEPRAKRAAHHCFATLRRALYTADTSATGIVFCYLWGAWLLAQSTEGINDGTLFA